jgi:putative DNA primase/helicase
MGGNRDLVEFLQRCVGYSLFGGNPEQVLFVLHGHGANGKSTFVRLLQDLFGGYARAVESSLLMVRRSENANGGPREDIVRLKDARLVLATEIGEGQWLDEERVKRLTGGDTLAGRVPYGRSTIEFQPKFALWLSTNHKPVIHGGDHAIWRRIVLIPFTQTFSDGQKDEMLLTKLRAELPGVLNWAIKGCLAWQERNGLDMPKIVLDATREYRTEMDLIGEWISDACMTGTDRMDTVADLYQSYQQWAEASGLKVLSRQAFGRKLTERGFEQAWPKGQRGYRGIEVKPVVHDFQTLAAA